jgi:hypothetical protein
MLSDGYFSLTQFLDFADFNIKALFFVVLTAWDLRTFSNSSFHGVYIYAIFCQIFVLLNSCTNTCNHYFTRSI